jgi:Fe2+ or Zn2+ uptake regulation protein
MEAETVAKALGSRDRLRTLKLLVRGPAGAAEVHRRYESEFRHKRNRVSVYRDLEVLVRAGLVRKRYDGDSKQLVYEISSRRIRFDLVAQEVSLE